MRRLANAATASAEQELAEIRGELTRIVALNVALIGGLGSIVALAMEDLRFAASIGPFLVGVSGLVA